MSACEWSVQGPRQRARERRESLQTTSRQQSARASSCALHHQGGVIRAIPARYSVTPVKRMRPDDRCGSRHSRHPPAFMSTPHRAQVAARVVSDAGTTPTIRTWQHPGGQPDGESCPYVAPFLPVLGQLSFQYRANSLWCGSGYRLQ